MKKYLRILTAICGFALCGCITQSETVYRNPERMKVEFENETAARVFYETLSQHPTPSQHESTTKVEIPIIFEHQSKFVDGENVSFNDAVRRCDINQDGKITELEAKIFAQSFAKN